MLDARTDKDRTGRLPDVPDPVNSYVRLFQGDDDSYEGEPPTTVRRTAG
ncbi:hypothetical protein [Streptomyces sp. S3(2020)]|nr:hypothetical protein [Streptomyces sp. S3(2020)]